MRIMERGEGERNEEDEGIDGGEGERRIKRGRRSEGEGE